MATDYILEMEDINKYFPGVRALSDVTFRVKRGHIHALVGENGAGKSTLIKIISGVYPHGAYEGTIKYDGKIAEFNSISEVEKAGIGCIHQELNLVPDMSVAENIFLTGQPNRLGWIDFDTMHNKSLELLQQLGLNSGDNLSINPEEKVRNLGIGQQQMVEIAKALAKDVKLLILDEPTAALTEAEVEVLLNIVRNLREKGVTCIYISHRLDEIMNLADTVTILRDGETVDTRAIEDLTKQTMIELMVGRELTNMFPREEHRQGELVLEVNNYSVKHPTIPNRMLIDDVSFKAYKGEILGICGLMGAGRTELFTSIYGAFPVKGQGEIKINGEKVTINSPTDALKHGFTIATEDRKKFGLNLLMSIKENTTITGLEKVSNMGILNEDAEIAFTNDYVEQIHIVTPHINVPVSTLSGGNQQKVVLSKALFSDPKIIVMDEPSRGIDVGARFEIYKLMNELVDDGVVIIMISSDMEEILGMSDRILTMSEGKFTAEYDISDATQEKLLASSVC